MHCQVRRLQRLLRLQYRFGYRVTAFENKGLVFATNNLERMRITEDGDVGIVLDLIDKEPKANGHQEIMIWWCYENARKGIGIESFSFEPFGETETVLRY